MNRRGFLGAILAAGTAPAIAGSGILMPLRKLVLPSEGLFIPEMAPRLGNQLLTMEQITREALRLFVATNSFGPIRKGDTFKISGIRQIHDSALPLSAKDLPI